MKSTQSESLFQGSFVTTSSINHTPGRLVQWDRKSNTCFSGIRCRFPDTKIPGRTLQLPSLRIFWPRVGIAEQARMRHRAVRTDKRSRCGERGNIQFCRGRHLRHPRGGPADNGSGPNNPALAGWLFLPLSVVLLNPYSLQNSLITASRITPRTIREIGIEPRACSLSPSFLFSVPKLHQAPSFPAKSVAGLPPKWAIYCGFG